MDTHAHTRKFHNTRCVEEFERCTSLDEDSQSETDEFGPLGFSLAPRKFRILKNIPDEAQLIWMEHRPGSPSRKEPKKKKEGGIQKTKDGKKSVPKRDSRLMPKRIVLEGLSGKELILARRKSQRRNF
ncbi:hypothetical protein HF086_015556 [Spodoptera exigua]|uniref:Uncharacterized protein n=1 Tax=Spodoptera exigua TaxID=7107 RepID=A0A922SJ51_SPOEX|nr:hypothetical protein HF086_015556 [Spodoptera exigua]